MLLFLMHFPEGEAKARKTQNVDALSPAWNWASDGVAAQARLHCVDSEKVVVVGRLTIGRTGAAVALLVGGGLAVWLGASALPGVKSATAAGAPVAAPAVAKPAVAASSTAAAGAAAPAAAPAPARVMPAAAASKVQGPTPVFVLNSLDASISVVDSQTWKEQSRIPTGKEPHHLYLTPDEKTLVVANALGDSLTLVDPRTGAVQRVIRDIVDPYHLRFSPDMKWFITAANRLNHIDFYRWDAATQTPTLVKRVSTGKTPSHLFIDAQSKTLYSTMQDSDALVAIDIAVPCDIEPSVGDIRHVTLYNIDDLQDIVESNIRFREGEAERAKGIIEEEIESIEDRFTYLSTRPVMVSLSDKAEEIRQRELRHIFAKIDGLTEEDKRVLQYMTRMIVRKILREPMMHLNEHAGTKWEDADKSAVTRLFKLDVRKGQALEK